MLLVVILSSVFLTHVYADIFHDEESIQEALINAIAHNDVYLVEQLTLSVPREDALGILVEIKRGTYDEQIDGMYGSVIGFAVSGGHMNFIEFFLNHYGQEILHFGAATFEDDVESLISPLGLAAHLGDVEMFLFLSHYVSPAEDRSVPSIPELALQAASCSVISAWAYGIWKSQGTHELLVGNVLREILGRNTLHAITRQHVRQRAGWLSSGDFCAIGFLLHINSVRRVGEIFGETDTDISRDSDRAQNDNLLGSSLLSSFGLFDGSDVSKSQLDSVLMRFTQDWSKQVMQLQHFVERMGHQKESLQRRVDEQRERIDELESMVAHLQNNAENPRSRHEDVVTAVVDSLMSYKYI